MRKLIGLLAVLAVLPGLAACGLTKENLGMTTKAPNEFMVAPRPPLSLPPEYNLRPVVEPQPTEKQDNALLSTAEQKLLAQIDQN